MDPGRTSDGTTQADGEAMKQRERAKAQREAALEEEIKAEIAAESFDDLSDEEVKEMLRKEEL